MTQTIEQLTARIAELEEELERKMSAGQYVLEQLSASQLHAEQLREALEAFAYRFPESQVAKEALAIPHDTSALDAYVAEKVKEAMK